MSDLILFKNAINGDSLDLTINTRSQNKNDLALVRKILLDKSLNIIIVKNILLRAWETKPPIKITKLEQNLICLNNTKYVSLVCEKKHYGAQRIACQLTS